MSISPSERVEIALYHTGLDSDAVSLLIFGFAEYAVAS